MRTNETGPKPLIRLKTRNKINYAQSSLRQITIWGSLTRVLFYFQGTGRSQLPTITTLLTRTLALKNPRR